MKCQEHQEKQEEECLTCTQRALDAARLQIRALRDMLFLRRVNEPQHSREDHECAECTALRETRPEGGCICDYAPSACSYHHPVTEKSDRPIEEELQKLAKAVPPEEWEKMKSKQHERYQKLVAAAQRIGCTCGHDHRDRKFNCNCCEIRYALEDLGAYTGGPYAEKPKADWAICGWCSGMGVAGGLQCPKCLGTGGRVIEKRKCADFSHKGPMVSAKDERGEWTVTQCEYCGTQV